MKGELGMMLSLQNVMQKQVHVPITQTHTQSTDTHAHSAFSLHETFNMFFFLLFCMDSVCHAAEFSRQADVLLFAMSG